MANAFAAGRPIAPLVLSEQERAYLERQVRRHRVARSLSERCRVILRCADGLPGKSAAGLADDAWVPERRTYNYVRHGTTSLLVRQSVPG